MKTAEQRRWPSTGGSPVCPYCGSAEAWEIKGSARTGDPRWQCRGCGYNYGILTGTAMSSGRVPAETWRVATEAYEENPRITSVALGKVLGVTQKTAWWMRKKLKTLGPDGVWETGGVRINNTGITVKGSPEKINMIGL